MTICENEIIKLDYVNDQLDCKTKEQFELHLRSCAACRQEVRELLTLATGIRAIPHPVAPRHVVERTQALIVGSKPPHIQTPWWDSGALSLRFTPLYHAIAAALIAIVLISVFAVFQSELSILLQTKTRVSLMPLLRGSMQLDQGVPGSESVGVPFVTILVILAIFCIPSVFENSFSLLIRKSLTTGSLRQQSSRDLRS